MGKFIDLKGQKFGGYTVLEYTGINQKWKCQCECGHIAYMKGNHLTAGRSKGCRSCSNRLPEGQAGFNNLLSKYKTRCITHKRVFDLSEEEFKEITSSNCHYCGVSPYKESKSTYSTSENTKKHSIYLYNGIDRIDSSLGYTKENSVPCCEICNKAKRDMSYNDFINYLKRIIKFYETNTNKC